MTQTDAAKFDTMLHGDLAEILALCDDAKPNDARSAVDTAECQVLVVMGAYNHRDLPLPLVEI